MLLNLAMLLLLIACFLAMAALVLFCDGVIAVPLPHPAGHDPRIGKPADDAWEPIRQRREGR
jgi:hypothetical protein